MFKRKSKFMMFLLGIFAVLSNWFKAVAAINVDTWYLDAIGFEHKPTINNNADVRVYVIDERIDAEHPNFAYGAYGAGIIVPGPHFNSLNFTSILYNNTVLSGFVYKDIFYGSTDSPDDQDLGSYIKENADLDMDKLIQKMLAEIQAIPLSNLPNNSLANVVVDLPRYGIQQSHGTSVATAIAGKINNIQLGVAAHIPNLHIISVSYGDPINKDIFDAVKWSTRDCLSARHTNPRTRCVFNLSLGMDNTLDAFSKFSAEDLNKILQHSNPLIKLYLGSHLEKSSYFPITEALLEAARQGISIAIAAGNEGLDACTSTPADATLYHVDNENVAPIMVAGATNKDNKITGFSNHGKCVSVYAPGNEILVELTDTRASYADGTSISSPLVAAAQVLCWVNFPALQAFKECVQQMMQPARLQVDDYSSYASSTLSGEFLDVKVLRFPASVKPMLFSNLTERITQDLSPVVTDDAIDRGFKPVAKF